MTFVLMVATYVMASSAGIVTEPENIARNLISILVGSIISVFVLNILVKALLAKHHAKKQAEVEVLS